MPRPAPATIRHCLPAAEPAKIGRMKPISILSATALLCLALPLRATDARPWMDARLPADQRADLLLGQMSTEEKLQLIRSRFGMDSDKGKQPAGALGSAGFVAGIERLGIPAQQLVDAGLGVTNPGAIRKGDHATAMPSGTATAASWNPALAHAEGAAMGEEAWRQGFNVLLAGGVNLQRDPRGGRNFEYAGEDPLLAGTMAGASIAGIQSRHVVATLKHYALNDMETARNFHDVRIGEQAMRESDLLAAEIALDTGKPGAVMCAYNRVGGIYACEHAHLLGGILKGQWKYPGYVMSDWGGVHSGAEAALAGLDQASAGEVFDKQEYFDGPLRAALADGTVPQARLDDMARRILRSLFAVGGFEHPPMRQPVDDAAGLAVAERAAEQGIVLLRNQGGLLPIAPSVRSIAVIGGHADKGVMGGGGSSMVGVTAAGGNAVPGLAPTTWPGPVMFHPSSPLAALRAALPGIRIDFADGSDPTRAAALARDADLALVFATQWSAESRDLPDMRLPDGQDALIEAVAAANPRTAVVLETNGPVRLPWLRQVPALLQAWYPGSGGGPAIARVLTGQVDASGRLPVSWPVDESQLPRPTIPGLDYKPDAGMPLPVFDYDIEGANVGYRWFATRGLVPAFPFGHGLSYTRFEYGPLTVRSHGRQVTARFTVRNSGVRAGTAIPQLYVHMPAGNAVPFRLAGWKRVELQPGQSREVTVTAEPRTLADFDTRTRQWRIPAGSYRLALARSATDVVAEAPLVLVEQTF